jgi:CheY-like chemotaxis protein
MNPGHGQESDRQRAFEAGFDSHVVKPPDARILLEFFDSWSDSSLADSSYA